ncbi:uncharacterized protein LOC117174749 [Belonocnema kinseyi]|uniref:uncharacterized protein LOC117174749 n=1 Tax=Belonocnema kinseyi TaxID=2817044 RepID=UPI00143DC45B|nr:uncharacterized protein LOC117174749 [Belonocnema kinseyi]
MICFELGNSRAPGSEPFPDIRPAPGRPQPRLITDPSVHLHVAVYYILTRVPGAAPGHGYYHLVQNRTLMETEDSAYIIGIVEHYDTFQAIYDHERRRLKYKRRSEPDFYFTEREDEINYPEGAPLSQETLNALQRIRRANARRANANQNV